MNFLLPVILSSRRNRSRISFFFVALCAGVLATCNEGGNKTANVPATSESGPKEISKSPITSLAQEFTNPDRSPEEWRLKVEEIAAWAKKEPARVLDAVLALPDQPLKTALLGKVLASIASVDPELALGNIHHLPSESVFRVRTIYAAASKVAEADWENASAIIRERASSGDAPEMLASLYRESLERGWGESNAIFEKLPFGVARSGAITATVERIARDPAGTIRFIESLHSDELTGARSTFLLALEKDSKLVDELYLGLMDGTYSLPDEFERTVVETKFSALSSEPISKVLEVASGLKSQEQRNAAISAVVGALGRSNPSKVTDAWNQLQDLPNTPDLAFRLVSSWETNDPKAAITWASGTIEDPALRSRLLERVTKNWLRSDPESASSWVSENLGGADSDALANEVVSYLIMSGDFEDAKQWISAIGEKSMRDEAQARIDRLSKP